MIINKIFLFLGIIFLLFVLNAIYVDYKLIVEQLKIVKQNEEIIQLRAQKIISFIGLLLGTITLATFIKLGYIVEFSK
jgi:uncharacterized membrane protein